MRYVLTIDRATCPVRVHRCTSFAARLRGMSMYGARYADDAWYLQPCRAIHTLFQRRAIDVIFCDASDRVLCIRSALAPWRIAWCRGAHSVWEFSAGQAQRWQLARGQQLSSRCAP
jgi:uncharacterized membrane protein (UPF0127 family)